MQHVFKAYSSCLTETRYPLILTSLGPVPTVLGFVSTLNSEPRKPFPTHSKPLAQYLSFPNCLLAPGPRSTLSITWLHFPKPGEWTVMFNWCQTPQQKVFIVMTNRTCWRRYTKYSAPRSAIEGVHFTTLNTLSINMYVKMIHLCVCILSFTNLIFFLKFLI